MLTEKTVAVLFRMERLNDGQKLAVWTEARAQFDSDRLDGRTSPLESYFENALDLIAPQE